jgi:hypothetical protein
MKVFVTTFLLLCSFAAAFGQGAYVTASASDRYEPGSMLINPALALGGEQFIIGLKTHQMGAVGGAFKMRSVFLTYASPFFLPRGSSLGLEHFDTGMYRRTRFQVGYSMSPLRDLDLGLSAGVHAINYSGFQGDDIDLQDPLLVNNSSLAPTLTLGMTYRWNHVVLGLSLLDINQPDIALGDSPVKLPMRYTLSAGMVMGNFEPFISLNNLNTYLESPGFFGDDMVVSLGFRYSLNSQNFLSGAFYDRGPSLGGGAMITRNTQLYLRYDGAPQEMSDFSYGSSTFAFCWDMIRHHSMPIFDVPGAPQMQPNLPRGLRSFSIENSSKFFILSPIRELDVVEMDYSLKIDFDYLRDMRVKHLPLYALIPANSDGEMISKDSILPENLDRMKLQMREEGRELPDSWGFSPRYLTEMMTSRYDMDKKATDIGVIALNPQALDQALVMADQMESESGSMKIEALLDDRGYVPVDALEMVYDRLKRQTHYFLNHRKYRIWIVPIHMEGYDGTWTLSVMDGLNREVHAWSGRGLPPDYIDWDWKLSDGTILAPGDYQVDLTYQAKGRNDVVSARPQFLEVTRAKHTDSTVIERHAPKQDDGVYSKTFMLGLGADEKREDATTN